MPCIFPGTAYSIQEILDKLLSMTNVQIEIQQDPARLRPSDVPILLGDNSKFSETGGWKPEISFDKTLEDILNYWRKCLV